MEEKIAFVDDEQSVLTSLKWIFRDAPFQVFTFDSPARALEAMKKSPFAAVAADQRLPGCHLGNRVRVWCIPGLESCKKCAPDQPAEWQSSHSSCGQPVERGLDRTHEG